MSNVTKLAVPALLLIAAAASAFYFLQGPSHDIAPAPKPVVPAPVAPPANPGPATEPTPVVAPPTAEPERVAATPSRNNTNVDAPQGVKGRILLPTGQPAAHVPVYLMENSMNNPLGVYLAAKSGQVPPPVASGETAEDGTFALGARVADKLYDLRVVSETHPEKTQQQLKISEDDWYDTGDLTLDVGNLVSGRVVDDLSKAPVPDAVVFLVSANQAYTLVPTPGRERGLMATAGSDGSFRITNAPTQGIVNLTVEARGYATTSLQNQPLKAEGNDFVIEIARGQPIAGVVVDQSGKPAGNVRITAAGMSAKTPQTAEVVSGSDGVFAFEALREGPYQLVTNSTHFNETRTPPVMTGEVDVKVVVTQKAFAKLRVVGANGQPVKVYSLSLKRHFPNNPLGIGNVPEFADRRVTPADYPAEFGGEWAAIRGLPTGEFVFQLQDQNHAKSLSAAFRVVEGEGAPEVQAVLTLGAAVTGMVVDDRGQPVAGATVSTDMNNAFSGDGGFFDIFKSFIPEKHSKAQAKTDARGRFRLGKLAFAEYMIRVSHPEFCEGTALDIRLENEGQEVDVGTVMLSRGAIVEGFTTMDGLAAGQVKVTITVPQPETPPTANPSQPPKPMFSASVVSDNDGRYRMLKRVPPGTYKIHASRQTGENNIFEKLFDMKETEQTLTVPPGQDLLRVNFNLSKR